jgi:hypothetical protein
MGETLRRFGRPPRPEKNDEKTPANGQDEPEPPNDEDEPEEPKPDSDSD